MPLFACRGCEAKDKEIAHLLGQLERLHQHVERAQARVAEGAMPGVEGRLKQAAEPRPPRPSLPRFRPTFPGYEKEPVPPRIVAEEPPS